MSMQPGDWFLEIVRDWDGSDIHTEKVTVVTYGPNRRGDQSVWIMRGDGNEAHPYSPSYVEGLEHGKTRILDRRNAGSPGTLTYVEASA